MNILFGILCLIIGFLNIKFPRQMVKFRHRRLMRGEPTEFAIKMTVFGGIIAIIIGIYSIFFFELPGTSRFF